MSDMICPPLFRRLQARLLGSEVFTEMLERRQHRVGREAAECAERAEFHGGAEILDQGEVGIDLLAAADLVDGFHAAGGADPARRALAAGFDRAKLHRKARLL